MVGRGYSGYWVRFENAEILRTVCQLRKNILKVYAKLKRIDNNSQRNSYIHKTSQVTDIRKILSRGLPLYISTSTRHLK